MFLPAHLGWVTVTSALMVTDLEHRLIPNRILYLAGIVTILLLVGGALVDGTPGRLGEAFLSAILCLVGMGDCQRWEGGRWGWVTPSSRAARVDLRVPGESQSLCRLFWPDS